MCNSESEIVIYEIVNDLVRLVLRLHMGPAMVWMSPAKHVLEFNYYCNTIKNWYLEEVIMSWEFCPYEWNNAIYYWNGSGIMGVYSWVRDKFRPHCLSVLMCSWPSTFWHGVMQHKALIKYWLHVLGLYCLHNWEK